MWKFVKDNVEFFALIVSFISLFLSFIRFRAQLATITKIVKLKFGSKYKARITLRDKNEQIEITGREIFRKERLLYRQYNPESAVLSNDINVIVGSKDIDLDFLENFDEGKYKIIYYTNRHPRKLKFKIKLPFDKIFD